MIIIPAFVYALNCRDRLCTRTLFVWRACISDTFFLQTLWLSYHYY